MYELVEHRGIYKKITIDNRISLYCLECLYLISEKYLGISNENFIGIVVTQFKGIVFIVPGKIFRINIGVIKGVINEVLDFLDQPFTVLFDIQINPLAGGPSVLKWILTILLYRNQKQQYDKYPGHLSVKLNFLVNNFNCSFT